MLLTAEHSTIVHRMLRRAGSSCFDDSSSFCFVFGLKLQGKVGTVMVASCCAACSAFSMPAGAFGGCRSLQEKSKSPITLRKPCHVMKQLCALQLTSTQYELRIKSQHA